MSSCTWILFVYIDPPLSRPVTCVIYSILLVLNTLRDTPPWSWVLNRKWVLGKLLLLINGVAFCRSWCRRTLETQRSGRWTWISLRRRNTRRKCCQTRVSPDRAMRKYSRLSASILLFPVIRVAAFHFHKSQDVVRNIPSIVLKNLVETSNRFLLVSERGLI